MPRSKSRTATTAARRRRPTASRPRKQRGGSRTVLPISYFGGDDSAAYTGKCGRSPIKTAYGGSVPTSFGELGTSLGADFAGPNLAPGSGVDGVSASALQTGGARRRRTYARRKSARRGAGKKRKTRASASCSGGYSFSDWELLFGTSEEVDKTDKLQRDNQGKMEVGEISSKGQQSVDDAASMLLDHLRKIK